MVIGIDFDNTLVDTKRVSKKYLDLYLPGNTLDSYHDLDYEKSLEFAEKYFVSITNDLSLLPGVKEAFAYFKKNNIKTVLITARGIDYPTLIEPTKKFLADNGISFDILEFGCPKKLEPCLKNNVDIMIDDIPGVIENVSAKGIKGILFGQESDKFTYALNWQEALDYIKGGLK